MKSMILIALIFLTYELNAQQSDKPNEYILVYFKKDVERIVSKNGSASKISTKFKANELKSKLALFGISEEDVTPSTPEFNEADTIIVSTDGIKIPKLNLAKLFKVREPAKNQAKVQKNIPMVILSDKMLTPNRKQRIHKIKKIGNVINCT